MGINVQNFAVANLRRRPAVVEIGGFVAGLDPETASPYINYATPLPGAEPTGRDVEALIAAFPRARTQAPARIRTRRRTRRGARTARSGIHHGGNTRVPRLHPRHAEGDQRQPGQVGHGA